MSDFASHLQDVSEAAGELLDTWNDDELYAVTDDDSLDFVTAVSKAEPLLAQLLTLLADIRDLAPEAYQRMNRRTSDEAAEDRSAYCAAVL